MERSRGDTIPPGRARLSALDAAFLFFERPNQPFQVGCVAELDGRVPLPELVALIEQRLCTRLPRYRQRPQRAVLDFDLPRWEDDPAFDLRRHVRHVALPAPGGAAELHGLVDALHAAPLDDRHPRWEVHLIDGRADGTSVVYVKMHHCMVDGVSGAQILELLTDGADAAEPTVAAAPPAGGSTVEERRAAGDFLRLLPGLATAGALARDAGELITAIASLALEPNDALPFNRRLGDRRATVWTTLRIEDLHGIRGRAGCKLNDVLLAIISGALHDYLETHGTRTPGLRVRAIVPVSVRRAEDRLQLGNLVSAMIPTLPVGESDPAARLRRIAAEMQELKGRGQPRAAGLLLAALGRLPAPFEALLGRLAPDGMIANTVCTNVPGPSQPRTLLGRRVGAVHPIAPLFQSMGLEFAILSYADTVSVSATADPDLVPDLQEIAAGIEKAARELVAATPEPDSAKAFVPAAAAPRVADLMSREVVTIRPDDSVLHAHQLMCERRIRHLPVLGGNDGLTGIVTMRDVMAASASSLEHPSDAARARVLETGRVGDVMEAHVCTAAPGESAATAGERMARLKIGCLPVVDEDGHVLGIVTQDDFVHWATSHMARHEAADQGARTRTRAPRRMRAAGA